MPFSNLSMTSWELFLKISGFFRSIHFCQKSRSNWKKDATRGKPLVCLATQCLYIHFLSSTHALESMVDEFSEVSDDDDDDGGSPGEMTNDTSRHCFLSICLALNGV